MILSKEKIFGCWVQWWVGCSGGYASGSSEPEPTIHSTGWVCKFWMHVNLVVTIKNFWVLRNFGRRR
uniref:Candidate secreted effector n=1 Tax=Meloidogyne incognita TaxID=6306 RepID=A0A914MKJ3_MELIC